ncbi:MAG: hypothetical protein ACTTI3_04140 [Treponema sp.]
MNLDRLKDKIKKGRLSPNALNVSQGISFFLFLCIAEAEEAGDSSFSCFTCAPSCTAASCAATSCSISCAQGASIL